MLVDLDPDRLQTVAAGFDRPLVHPMDVRDPDAWGVLAARVVAERGGAHLLVNNAGVTVHGRFADQTRADIDRVLDVNLRGLIYGCHAFLPQLVAQDDAHIVNLSSFAGFVGFPFQSTYSASKFGVRGFSAALRAELASEHVGVTAVMPGTVATPFLERAGSTDPEGAAILAKLMQERGVPPKRLALRILSAIRWNRAEIVVGWEAHLTGWVQWAAPWLPRIALERMLSWFTVDGRWRGRP